VRSVLKRQHGNIYIISAIALLLILHINNSSTLKRPHAATVLLRFNDKAHRKYLEISRVFLFLWLNMNMLIVSVEHDSFKGRKTLTENPSLK